MTGDGPPPTPLPLAHLPTSGGRVVPWVTPHTRGGTYLFGAVDQSRVQTALIRRLCGVCGHGLEERLVLLLRASDLPRQASVEPALHPHCAAYTATACPMIAGTLSHYRSSPHPRYDEDMVPAADNSLRRGAPAEPWFAVWLRRYRIIRLHGHLAASYAGIPPLRIRPVSDAHLTGIPIRGWTS